MPETVCELTKDKIHLYIDGILDGEEAEFISHIESCPDCRRELEEFRLIVNKLSEMPIMEIPDGFHGEIMEYVRANKGHNELKVNFAKFTQIAAGLIITFIAINASIACIGNLLDGHSASNQATLSSGEEQAESILTGIAENYALYDAVDNDAFEESEELYAADTDIAAIVPFMSMDSASRKNLPESQASTEMLISKAKLEMNRDSLIKNFNIVIETENFEYLLEKISEISGETISESIYSKDYRANMEHAYIIKSVSADKVEDVLSELEILGKITSSSENRLKVSGQVDIDYLLAGLTVKQEEYDRLLAMLDQANTLGEMIAVDERLSSVIGQLDYYKGEVNRWVKQAESAALSISVRGTPEVIMLKAEEESFTNRVKTAFLKSAHNFVIFSENVLVAVASAALPVALIVIAAIIVWIVVIWTKRLKLGLVKK